MKGQRSIYSLIYRHHLIRLNIPSNLALTVSQKSTFQQKSHSNTLRNTFEIDVK